MRTITVSSADVSLFHVAAKELGGACNWIRLAQENGIVDPMITSVGTLQIPTIGTKNTTGLPE